MSLLSFLALSYIISTATIDFQEYSLLIYIFNKKYAKLES